MRTTNTGFTLIELLVVMAIIGTLASVVLASLNTAREKARDAERVANLRNLDQALQLYWVDNDGNYPSTSGSWRGSSSGCYGGYGDNAIPGLVSGGYIGQIPVDPTGTGGSCYLYRSNGSDFKILAHQTMETCNAGNCPLQDPVRTSQRTSTVYSEGGRNW